MSSLSRRLLGEYEGRACKGGMHGWWLLNGLALFWRILFASHLAPMSSLGCYKAHSPWIWGNSWMMLPSTSLPLFGEAGICGLRLGHPCMRRLCFSFHLRHVLLISHKQCQILVVGYNNYIYVLWNNSIGPGEKVKGKVCASKGC